MLIRTGNQNRDIIKHAQWYLNTANTFKLMTKVNATCHRAGIKWLTDSLHDFTGPNIWPSISSDPNQVNYFAWSLVERDCNRSSSNTKAALEEPLVEHRFQRML